MFIALVALHPKNCNVAVLSHCNHFTVLAKLYVIDLLIELNSADDSRRKIGNDDPAFRSQNHNPYAIASDPEHILALIFKLMGKREKFGGFSLFCTISVDIHIVFAHYDMMFISMTTRHIFFNVDNRRFQKRIDDYFLGIRGHDQD